MQEKSELQHPSIRKMLLKQLLILLKQDYDANEMNETIKTMIESVFKFDSIDKVDETSEIQIDCQKKEIQIQLQKIITVIGKSPSIWISLLENDDIPSDTLKVILNKPVVLTKIFRKIVQLIEKEFKNTPQNLIKYKQFDFQDEYINQKNLNLFAALLSNIANQLSESYHEGVKFIKQQMREIQKKLKNCKIMNTYILFAILKQETKVIETKIKSQLLSGILKNSSGSPTQFFSSYVMKNYERLQLICDSNDDASILNKQQYKQFIQSQNQQLINFFAKSKGKLKRLASSQGQEAFLIIQKSDEEIKEQNASKPASGIIVTVRENQQIKMTNTKITQKSWYALDIKDSAEQLKNYLTTTINYEEKEKIDQQLINSAVPLDAYATVGGNLGRCLADINKYKNANQFLKDLSAKTAISGSTMYLMMEIPIIGYFFIAGGFSYSFYQVFSNQATNDPKKYKQFAQASAVALGTAGTSITGMLIGQALIPIPFLGAFIGGLVGGFLGTKGSQQIVAAIENEDFQRIFKYLSQNIMQEGYWHYSKKMLEVLGVDQYYFEKTNPFVGYSRNYWTTAICFCVASFYESKKYAQFTQNRVKQLKQKQRTIQVGKQQVYEGKFKLVTIIDYLTLHDVKVMENLEVLQGLVSHLINK